MWQEVRTEVEAMKGGAHLLPVYPHTVMVDDVNVSVRVSPLDDMYFVFS